MMEVLIRRGDKYTEGRLCRDTERRWSFIRLGERPFVFSIQHSQINPDRGPSVHLLFSLSGVIDIIIFN